MAVQPRDAKAAISGEIGHYMRLHRLCRNDIASPPYDDLTQLTRRCDESSSNAESAINYIVSCITGSFEIGTKSRAVKTLYHLQEHGNSVVREELRLKCDGPLRALDSFGLDQREAVRHGIAPRQIPRQVAKMRNDARKLRELIWSQQTSAKELTIPRQHQVRRRWGPPDLELPEELQPPPMPIATPVVPQRRVLPAAVVYSHMTHVGGAVEPDGPDRSSPARGELRTSFQKPSGEVAAKQLSDADVEILKGQCLARFRRLIAPGGVRPAPATVDLMRFLNGAPAEIVVGSVASALQELGADWPENSIQASRLSLVVQGVAKHLRDNGRSLGGIMDGVNVRDIRSHLELWKTKYANTSACIEQLEFILERAHDDTLGEADLLDRAHDDTLGETDLL